MEMSIYNKTMIGKIKSFMNGTTGGVATLKEIYANVKSQFEKNKESIPNHFEEKVRCVILRDKNFKRVTRGLYMYTGANTAGLIIHGDGRKLEEIEDNSIDLIITDHAWKDTKAHKSGNQKNFTADYEDSCFRYELEDFKQKARVLKPGAYLVECLPTESASNYEYLYEIKMLAKEAGFKYYSKIMWIKQSEGKVNTGRSTKGTEDIMIFSKGKPRRLSPPKKPYLTKTILSGRLDIPAPLPKDKRHQAEKPVKLYEYLIEAMSEENDVLLDQFGGSCNMIEAAVKKNRFAIVYELLKKFVTKAVNRLGAKPIMAYEEDLEGLTDTDDIKFISLDEVLGHQPEVNLVVVDEPKGTDESSEDIITDEICESENIILNEIPNNISEFQKNTLLNLQKHKPEWFDDNTAESILLDTSSIENKLKINKAFNDIYENAYEKYYKRIETNLDLIQSSIYREVQQSLNNLFIKKVENSYIRNFYKNYLIETEDFAKYMIKKCNAKDLSDIQSRAYLNIDKYLNLVSKHNVFKGKDIQSVKTMILKMLA